MHQVIQKTFGGLEPRYYFRHLFFASLMAIPMLVFFYSIIPKSKPGSTVVFVLVASVFAINTFLYPYARFVYEGVVRFIAGDVVIFGNLLFMLTMKVLTMWLCWSFAIFIAPFGLIYLYFHHNKSR